MWLVDEGVLLDLAHHATPQKLAGAPLRITEAMQANARDCYHRGPLLQSGVISVHAVPWAPHVSDHFRHLRRTARRPNADIGEHEAIALLYAWGEGAFVTRDKRAAMLAMHELGPGRVISPYDLWLALRRGGWIEEVQFSALCEATRKAEQAPLPWRLAGGSQGADRG